MLLTKPASGDEDQTEGKRPHHRQGTEGEPEHRPGTHHAGHDYCCGRDNGPEEQHSGRPSMNNSDYSENAHRDEQTA